MKRVLVLLCVIAPLACGVSPRSEAPGSYSEYLKRSSQLTCEARLRCCGTVCGSTEETAVRTTAALLDRYLTRSLVSYDAEAAAACLQAQSQRLSDCDASVEGLPSIAACDRVLIPLNPVGGTCETKVTSCVPEASCIQNRCVARPRVNDACTSTVGCSPPAYCNLSTARCVPYIESGQPCNTAGAMCNPGANLSCHPSVVCLPPQPDGAACANTSHCISRFCDPVARICAPAAPQTLPMSLREQLCASASL